MNETSARVLPWEGPDSPSESELHQRFTDEGLQPYSWSHSPGDVYNAHRHSYHKVIYVVAGSITFGLPEQGKKASLNPGDRLDLPVGMLHEAVVGPRGVRSLEAH